MNDMELRFKEKYDGRTRFGYKCFIKVLQQRTRNKQTNTWSDWKDIPTISRHDD